MNQDFEDIFSDISKNWNVYVEVRSGEKSKKDLLELFPVGGARGRFATKVNNGLIPFLESTEETVRFNVSELNRFVSEFYEFLGLDSAEQLGGVSRPAEAAIPREDVIQSLKDEMSKLFQSQTATELRKEMVEQDENFHQILQEKDRQIQELQTKINEQDMDDIRAEMSRPVTVVLKDHVQTDPAALEDQNFLRSGSKVAMEDLISRRGGYRRSYFDTSDPDDGMSVGKLLDWTVRPLTDPSNPSGLFENIFDDEEVIRQDGLSDEQVEDLRLRKIQALLNDTSKTNQQKLVLYSSVIGYHGKNSYMNSALEFAVEHNIDADYFITVMENPDKFHNFDMLSRALFALASPSEARVKIEAVREMISGDWLPLAQYDGTLTKFVLVPLTELKKFKESLAEHNLDSAVSSLDAMLSQKQVAPELSADGYPVVGNDAAELEDPPENEPNDSEPDFSEPGFPIDPTFYSAVHNTDPNGTISPDDLNGGY